jgi:hypothetical protein
MDEPQHPPRTIGELRRALADLGNPWTVDPRLGDAEPLPDPPRGAQRDEDVPPEARLTVVAPDADLGALLMTVLPANPFLRARWVELGLMTADESGTGDRGPGQ